MEEGGALHRILSAFVRYLGQGEDAHPQDGDANPSGLANVFFTLRTTPLATEARLITILSGLSVADWHAMSLDYELEMGANAYQLSRKELARFFLGTMSDLHITASCVDMGSALLIGKTLEICLSEEAPGRDGTEIRFVGLGFPDEPTFPCIRVELSAIALDVAAFIQSKFRVANPTEARTGHMNTVYRPHITVDRPGFLPVYAAMVREGAIAIDGLAVKVLGRGKPGIFETKIVE
jgi:hypothetical protein